MHKQSHIFCWLFAITKKKYVLSHFLLLVFTGTILGTWNLRTSPFTSSAFHPGLEKHHTHIILSSIWHISCQQPTRAATCIGPSGYVTFLLGCSWCPLTWPVNARDQLAWGEQGEKEWNGKGAGWREEKKGSLGSRKRLTWVKSQRKMEEQMWWGTPGTGPSSSVDILSHL